MEGKCCKCEEFKWPDNPPLEVVWIDPVDEKKSYCVFHAPTPETKHTTLCGELHNASSYNALVFDRFAAAKQKAIKCDMSGTIFPWPIAFTSSSVGHDIQRLDMSNCYFCDLVHFIDLTFCESSKFTNAIFKAETDFFLVVFRRSTSFGKAEFRASCEFQLCLFILQATFNGCHISTTLIFDQVFFLGRVGLSRLNAPPCSIIFKSMGEDILISSPTLTAHNRPPSETIGNICFASADIPLLVFSGCQWPDRLGPDKFYPQRNDTYRVNEQLYRAMKQRATEEHDQPLVSRWHFREKLMQLKQRLNNERSNGLLEVVEDKDTKWWIRAWAWLKLLVLPPYWPKRSLIGLYWAFSGFGERDLRAGIWLALLVALPFFIHSPIAAWLSFFWAAIPGTTNVNAFASFIRDSVNATAAVGFIPFMKETNGPSGWAKVGQALWQGVIILQFTLFALAVRNRFRR